MIGLVPFRTQRSVWDEEENGGVKEREAEGEKKIRLWDNKSRQGEIF